MPVRKRRRIRVILEDHAEKQWMRRARRPPGDLAELIEVLLDERLHGSGLPVYRGQARLPLDAELLDLPRPLVACLELPDIYGTWRVITFLHGKEENAS